ncbi:MAG: glycosyltransferase family 4 protein [Corynebacterium sp.]|nr:glycosyltransferase family 4 protein [Corynebacterium sp.]
MRIGFVCPYSFDEPGGVQAHILDLAKLYIKQGHTVGVLGPCSEDTEVPDFVTKGGASLPIKYNGSVARLSVGPKVIRTIKKFIEEGDFDVLHIHEPNVPGFALGALMNCEGPIVATYHVSATGSLLLKMTTPLLKPYLERIRGGIAVSELARRWQVEQLGADPVLIPNGVDTQFFRSHKKPKSNNEAVEIAFLGRLDEPRKGLNILLDALPAVKANLQDPDSLRVTVIGGGEHRDVPGVDFVGRVTDEQKAEILGRADIYVAPNTGGESFGIVLVEAMAAGAAVVATDLEAFRAVCDAESDTPAGALFGNGDSADLARVLSDLITNPDKRAALQAAGDKRSMKYDWDTVARDVMRVYEAVQDGTKVRLA